MKENPNLDLLRAVAVSLVVLSHATPVGGQAFVEAFNFGTFGRVGVALFFVHTTLVLMMSLERHGASAGPFLVRRFFRIYPLAIAAVLVGLAEKSRSGSPISLPEVAANLLLVQNLTGHMSMPNQLWTLPFEVQMYLFLPTLFAVTQRHRPLLRVALICAGSLALGLVLFYTLWKGGDLVSPFHYIPCFLPGVLAYVLVLRGPGTWSPVVLFGFVIAAAAVIPVLVSAGADEAPMFWVLCLLLGLLLPMCRSITYAPLVRTAKVVATYSYGIYLTHVLALMLGFGGMASHPRYVQWGMALLMLAGLPFAAYRLIEQPGIKLGVWLTEGPKKKTPAREAAGV